MDVTTAHSTRNCQNDGDDPILRILTTRCGVSSSNQNEIALPSSADNADYMRQVGRNWSKRERQDSGPSEWQAVVGGRNEETTVSMPPSLGIPQIT